MYAVIFKATIKQFDEEYTQSANRLRQLALDEYGCLEFISFTENNQELAISYWKNKEAISAWKSNAEHLKAQALGKSEWYESYSVEIVEVNHRYSFP